MKRFPETYQEAHEHVKKYTLAPRAGWIEQGKRTKDNQAILVRRTEVIRLADDLAQALYSGKIFLQQFFELRSIMEKMAEGEADSKRCSKCHRLFRTGWMEGRCPYCEATKAAEQIMVEKRNGSENDAE